MLSFCPVFNHHDAPSTAVALSMKEYQDCWEQGFEHTPYTPCGGNEVVVVADADAKAAWLAAWQRQIDACATLEVVEYRCYSGSEGGCRISVEEIEEAKHTIEQCRAEMDVLTLQTLEFIWFSCERSTRWVARKEVSG